jgi:hypothetical protein
MARDTLMLVEQACLKVAQTVADPIQQRIIRIDDMLRSQVRKYSVPCCQYAVFCAATSYAVLPVRRTVI